MKETKLFGNIFPAHPDFLPILEHIREKYNIPEIESTDEGIFTEIRWGINGDDRWAGLKPAPTVRVVFWGV